MATTTTAVNSGAGGFPALPLSQIRISPHNPRKRLDAASLAELTASIREHGVLEPILVRPVPAGKGGARFEIVAGERRFRAAGEAGLGAIPAISRELSDSKALELALIENLLRADLSAVEEAEGLKRLIDAHGYTVDDLAARTGRSRTYVYTRLRLVDLPAAAKKAVLDGTLTAAVALLIARIPDRQLQVKATREILGGGHDDQARDPLGFKAASRHVRETYMLSLAKAPFPAGDATLLPAVGACSGCPKRTGNNPDLFGDVSRTDMCTDPGCFAKKRDAAWERAKGAAAKAGRTVLPDREARRVFNAGRLSYAAPYVDLEARCEVDPKGRTWQRLLGKRTPEVILARDDQGRGHQLVRLDAAETALAASGHRFARRSAGWQERDEERRKEDQVRRRRLEVLRVSAERALGELAGRVEAEGEPGAEFWRIVLAGLASGSWHEVIRLLVKRRGWTEKGVRPEEVLEEQAREMDAARLRGLVLELLVTRGALSMHDLKFGRELSSACALYGVDLKGIEAAVKTEVTARRPAKTQAGRE